MYQVHSISYEAYLTKCPISPPLYVIATSMFITPLRMSPDQRDVPQRGFNKHTDKTGKPVAG